MLGHLQELKQVFANIDLFALEHHQKARYSVVLSALQQALYHMVVRVLLA